MSEIRQDPMTKEWVIIAPRRGKRPHDLTGAERQARDGAPFDPKCPFCPGNEDNTPPAVASYPPLHPGSSFSWQVRVTPNKYPALDRAGAVDRRDDGVFRCMDGVGAHEVIVETPLHNRFLQFMELEEIELILRAYQERYLALHYEEWAKFVLIFKNYGPQAGTSLAHPHSQIVAAPIAPREIRHKYDVATDYYDDTGRCLYCDVVKQELESGERMILQTDKYVVFHPFASRSPFETIIAPRMEQPSFGHIPLQDVHDLAPVLRTTLRQISTLLGDPDYNLMVHTAPAEDENKSYFLWHIQILPRVTTPAGFELGSGMFINSMCPEDTAAFVRENWSEDMEARPASDAGATMTQPESTRVSSSNAE